MYGMGFWRFLQYHNAVPIAFSILLLGAGGVFAATNPEAIYSATQEVLSIDNTYIVNKNLDSYTPQVRITGVTEDEEHYFVAYDFTTIDLKDYVWQDVMKKEVMKVSKPDLGPFRDLGLYVMDQLKQKIDRELAYLKEVQALEKRSISQKMVATAYGGLIGQFLDEKTEVLPGYTPVVVPPAPPEPEEGAGGSVASGGEGASGGAQSSSGSQGQGAGGQTGPTPVIDILGENPARVALGASYTDLGAVITGPTDRERGLTLHVFLNDKDVQQVSIDTSKAGEWKVSYRVFDGGVVTSAERIVSVYDPALEASQAAQSATTTATTSPSSPEPEGGGETPATTTPETTPSPAAQEQEPEQSGSMGGSSEPSGASGENSEAPSTPTTPEPASPSEGGV
jgi:hypothetical protein